MNKLQITERLAFIAQLFSAWFMVWMGSNTLLRMGRVYDGMFVNRNSVNDWLPVLAATAIIFGLLLHRATDFAVKKGKRYIAISLLAFTPLIIIGTGVASFSTNSLLLQDSLMLSMPLFAAGWMFGAATSDMQTWREKLWAR
jgi:hypothetical protein